MSQSNGFGVNDTYVEALRAEWEKDPQSVGPEWAAYFMGEQPTSLSVENQKKVDSALNAEIVQPIPTFSHIAGLSGDAAQPQFRAAPQSKDSVQSQSPKATVNPAPSVSNKEPVKSSVAKSTPEAAPAKAEPSNVQVEPLRGIKAKIVENMESSLEVPTATSTRVVPVKVLEENRRVVNQHLIDGALPKTSFTHYIGWAIVRASTFVNAMNNGYDEKDGKPVKLVRPDLNLGLAVDLPGRDGSRTLVVPNIKAANKLSFSQFLDAYNDIVARSRKSKLKPDDFADTTISLTNPGGIGTVSSNPRLMKGQGTIVAVGKIGYPAEYEATAPDTIRSLGIGKVMTMTSTYDHRVIQGAESGRFLNHIHELLAGEHGFYEEIFSEMGISHLPYHVERDRSRVLGVDKRYSETERAMKVSQLIHAFRVRGHILANCDPLDLTPRHHPDLDMANYGLTIWDLDRSFATLGVLDQDFAPLRDILERLRQTYCSRTGIEYMYINQPEEREWLRARIEEKNVPLEKSDMKRILRKLSEATSFERFLHKRYLGQKRFSVEGGESLIPTLDCALSRAAFHGVERIFLGMAHRGRLNVLTNVVGKSYEAVFSEFDDIDPKTMQGSGDVKYHLGAQGDFRWKGVNAQGVEDERHVRVRLACNPSHLEAVNPVVLGEVRAQQDLDCDRERQKTVPILIHGDAAFAGQGVVYETMQMSELPGYHVGGTIHVIVNNQIGYTTGPEKARTALNASDVARTIACPVFRVNGDDPEACARAMETAFDYRMKFKRDVIIDLVCYRLHGHNEGDEPGFTQPILYSAIRQHPSVYQRFGDLLVRRGDMDREEVDGVESETFERLERAFEELKAHGSDAVPENGPAILSQMDQDAEGQPVTSVSEDLLKNIAEHVTFDPEEINVHPRLQKQILAKRREMVVGNAEGQRIGIDIGMAETLAYGSLLLEGIPVRMSGQDCGRGTFAHRHAIMYDVEDGRPYIPLNYLRTTRDDGLADWDPVRFRIYDSFLSEEAVLGYEYGYSSVHPDSLVIWEAQFGDFFNGAQIQVDQFITSGETKWGQRSRVVMMLPHGYDGQGPEHSSARMERFLQQCAEENIRVCVCSTSAQQFHLLRQQAKQPKKPLILFTHKSLLRSSHVASDLSEFTSGSFKSWIDDPTYAGGSVDRVILCAGKVYWDLVTAREKSEADLSTRIIRVESLYPFPQEALAAAQATPGTPEIVWVQEEPENMGAFHHVRNTVLREGVNIKYCGRISSSSPATGSSRRHKAQQAEILRAALNDPIGHMKEIA